MDSGLLARWAFAFLLTQLIEIPIYVRGLRVRPIAAFGASAITHPIVCFVFPAVWTALYHYAVSVDPRAALGPTARLIGYGVLAEGFAVLAEAAYFRALGAERPLRWSILANAASAGLGVILWWLFGWP